VRPTHLKGSDHCISTLIAEHERVGMAGRNSEKISSINDTRKAHGEQAGKRTNPWSGTKVNC
jgi:hypothetical protein